MLARIADQKAGGQAESDYNVPKGLTLRDEIARYFRIGQALFTDLRASATPTAAATTRFVEGLLDRGRGRGRGAVVELVSAALDEYLSSRPGKEFQAAGLSAEAPRGDGSTRLSAEDASSSI